MKVFALSDIHIDYAENAQWLAGLSLVNYKNDVLLLAGDISDSLALIEWCFRLLVQRFSRVLFVPGNHDLWVIRDRGIGDSLEKLHRVLELARQCDVSTDLFNYGGLSIVPLLGWYDYSFGQPTRELETMWMDYRACAWPRDYDFSTLSLHFSQINDRIRPQAGQKVISFSHFLPRIDLMGARVKILHPVLGTTMLEEQIRRLRASIHVYGHSHLNRDVLVDGVRYINNAFGYPSEIRTAKQLQCIYED